MFLVRQPGTFRHEIAQIEVEHEHTELASGAIRALYGVSGPFGYDCAHDDEWCGQSKLTSELKQAFQRFDDTCISPCAAHTVVCRFVAINRKNKSEVLYPRHCLKMTLHQRAVRRYQHIEIAFGERGQ